MCTQNIFRDCGYNSHDEEMGINSITFLIQYNSLTNIDYMWVYLYPRSLKIFWVHYNRHWNLFLYNLITLCKLKCTQNIFRDRGYKISIVDIVSVHDIRISKHTTYLCAFSYDLSAMHPHLHEAFRQDLLNSLMFAKFAVFVRDRIARMPVSATLGRSARSHRFLRTWREA
jgi:hypothetical protein